MKIILPTVTSLHRTKFKRVRLGLTGLKCAKASFWKRSLNLLLLLFSVLSFLVAAVIFMPDFYYQVFPADVKPVETLETSSTWGGEFAATPSASSPAMPQEIAQPPQNENLPAGEWLIIPRIGVRTELRSTEQPEEALQQGVWLAPDYGWPGSGAQNPAPIILAAHRYGWQWWWQSDYWRYHSFYNLPELEPGDLVKIISDQRQWTYEIYAGEQGEKITDYEADLIMYTCKFLNSPTRHFRYARLIELW